MNHQVRYLPLVMLLAFGGCEKPSESAEADPVEEQVRELTPSERVALHAAEIAITSAFDSAGSSALRRVELDRREQVKTPPEELSGEGTRRLTVFFGSNNRGEREDCGCRKNPLGGLARRHTMFGALTDDASASDIWGESGTADGPVFHVDAGDSLFKSAMLKRGSPSAQKIARHDARAVVAALNTFPPDAMLAGELDWALGAEELRKLAADAEFPIITANVRTKEGEAPFSGAVKVERDGATLGIVGVTKKKTRLGDYWSSRGLTVEDPLEAANREIVELDSEVDAVVLLSNLGLKSTEELVDGIAEAGNSGKLALVVVSGTNRLTGDPEFASGVPIVEPLSRGKYVGRADVLLNGDSISYRNAGGVTATTLRDYRRALRSYWTTRRQLARHRKQVAEMEARAAEQTTRTDGGSSKELEERTREAIDSRKWRVKTYENRLKTVSDALREAVAQLDPGDESTGDDWVASAVVPVKIEITEEPRTARVVNRFQKRRPEPKDRQRQRNRARSPFGAH
jgi:hypothetical protein